MAVAMVLMLARVAQAASGADKCEAAKNKVAGKYAFCRQKAEAKAIKTGAPVDYTKCDAKYVNKWLTTENNSGGFAEHTDWRLPNLFELETLLDLVRVSPSFGPTFLIVAGMLLTHFRRQESRDCAATLAAKIRPIMLDGTISIVELEHKRLERTLRRGVGEKMQAKLQAGAIGRIVASGNRKYRRKLARIHRVTLNKAISAATALAGESPAAGDTAEELSRELATLISTFREGGDLPSNLIAPTALAGALATVAAVPNTLTVVIDSEGCGDGNDGNGTVTLSPTGRTCANDYSGGIECSAPIAAGTTVSLTPSAATGSRFIEFGGACTGTTCSVVVDGPTTVSATFCRTVL